MAATILPIVLEGDNLGIRHRQLNDITRNAFHSRVTVDDVKNAEEKSDVDALFKIDLANKTKDFDYLISNLCSNDSLKYTRCLKAGWIFTDAKYANVVNPAYLEKELFPLMSPKAIAKFLLKLRLAMKDEKRSEEFYEYYKSENEDLAKKFLPNCSATFLEKTFENVKLDVNEEVLGLLCRKSPNMATIYFKDYKDSDYKWDYIYEVRFLYSKYPEMYLGLVENYLKPDQTIFNRLGSRITKSIVTKHKHRLLEKPIIYDRVLKVNIMIRSLTQSEIKHMAAETASNILRRRYIYDSNFRKYAQAIDEKERYPFVKSVFKRLFPDEDFEMSEDFYKCEWYNVMGDKERYDWALRHIKNNTDFLENEMYKIYCLLDFDSAFLELVSLIQSEKTPQGRLQYFKALIVASGDSADNIYKLINYFTERHINEAHPYKHNFIAQLVDTKQLYQYDSKIWEVLLKLFNSVRLYENDCEVNLPKAVNATIIYHIINNIEISEKLEDKFFRDYYDVPSLSFVRGKIKEEDEIKIFKYLLKVYDHVKKYRVAIEGNDKASLVCITPMRCLIVIMNDWSKSLLDYPELIPLIKGLIRNYDIFYWPYLTRERQCRDIFFAEIVLKQPKEKNLLRALKKSTSYLRDFTAHEREIAAKHRIFLSKLRVYFHEDVAKQWIIDYRNELNDENSIHHVMSNHVVALCIMLCGKRWRMEFNKYVQDNPKIVRDEVHSSRFESIQSHVAKFNCLVRPTLPEDFILSFAKGKYLQNAIGSLELYCSHIPLNQVSGFIQKLIDSHVSVQKHGIRIASRSFRESQLKTLYTDLWSKTKNVSVKEVIFKYAFEKLCKCKIAKDQEDWCKIIKSFIKNLSGIKDRMMYSFIYQLHELPPIYLVLILEDVWSMIGRAENCIDDWQREIVMQFIVLHFERLNDELISDVVLQYLKTNLEGKLLITNGKTSLEELTWSLIAKCFAQCKDEATRESRITKLLNPLLKLVVTLWNETNGETYIVRVMFHEFVDILIKSAYQQLMKPETSHGEPAKLFQHILKEIEPTLTIEANYNLHMLLKSVILLSETVVLFLKESGDARKSVENYDTWLVSNTIERFGRQCANILAQSIEMYSPFVNTLFSKSISHFLSKLGFNSDELSIYFLKGLTHNLTLPNAVVAIQMLPVCDFSDKGLQAEFQKIVTHIKSLKNEEIKFLFDMQFNNNKKRKLNYSA